jgi:hypothetical protein
MAHPAQERSRVMVAQHGQLGDHVAVEIDPTHHGVRRATLAGEGLRVVE